MFRVYLVHQRDSLVSILVCGMALLLWLCLLPAPIRGEEPRDLYRDSINAVVWIENFVKNGSITGTGFLVDKKRRVIVTNYHVTNGEETMDVFFPVTNGKGLITDRKYYRDNRNALRATGHYSPGRVIAYDASKDLAIVRLSKLPATAVELQTASSDPEEDDRLYLLGNPAGRELWRLGPGVKPSVGKFQGKYSDYHISMNYKEVRYSVSSFGGNSGGPVLNAEGKVVGVHSSGGGEGGFRGGAVHWEEVDSLVGSIVFHRVFSIHNTSSVTLPYQIKWGDGEWKDHKVNGKSTMTHWHTGDKTVKPSIRFDRSADPGFQEKIYSLNYYTTYLGRNVKPSVEHDAREYLFRYDSTGRNLDVYKK